MKETTTPVAWVVGGPKGLGVMVAKGLAQDGYRIVINYRRSVASAHKLANELEQIGGESLVMQGDVSRVEDVKRMCNEVLTRWGRLDALICAAGPFTFRRIPLIECDDDTWREMIDGNLSGIFYLTRELIPVMRRQRYGRIITFGFPDVESPPAWPGYGPYAAAKTGLLALTRTIAAEEASYGITANMVVPGDIRDPYKEAPIAMARGQHDPRTPMGRPGTGEDIARVVRFLVHPDSDMITGAVIPITGGFTNERFYVEST